MQVVVVVVVVVGGLKQSEKTVSKVVASYFPSSRSMNLAGPLEILAKVWVRTKISRNGS